ncbi:MAG: hypothetical protein FJW95_09340 [Actinobacteria bacterium]|nr:hypothetical protein [Actinomycetota bacterium]
MPHPNPRASRAWRAALVTCATATAIAVTAVAPPAGAAKKPKAVVKMTPGEVTIYKTGNGPDALPPDVQSAVMTTLTGYVNAATVTPLRKGAANDAALGTALAAPVVARLATDRSVLVDEGLPKAVGRISVKGAPVALTGLADGGGNVVVVTADVATTATTKTAKGPLKITRSGELVLEPDNGTWKITGYTLTVDRVGKAIKAPTTTTVPAAPAAPTPTVAR